MVWIDVDIGGEAVDGRKMENLSPFLMREAFPGGPWGGHNPLYFML